MRPHVIYIIYKIYAGVSDRCLTLYIFMKKQAKSEFLSVRLSKETKAALEGLAGADERSLSWLVAKVLDTHVEQAAKRKK